MMDNTLRTYLVRCGQKYPIAPLVMQNESPNGAETLGNLKVFGLWPKDVIDAANGDKAELVAVQLPAWHRSAHVDSAMPDCLPGLCINLGSTRSRLPKGTTFG
jgi:hypothetical protein